MERLIYQQLINWKANPKRKPLVLNGARQVGKTYILHEFASKEYENVAYFSLDREDSVRELRITGTGTLVHSFGSINRSEPVPVILRDLNSP